MLNTWQNVAITILTVASSLLFMWGLNRVWPWEKRHAHNDLIGWQLSILGTTYAVILGFMLYTVWTNFIAAQVNAETEANALENLYRVAEGLPPQQRDRVETLARAYAQAVIDQDWPRMASGQIPESSRNLNQDFWSTLMSLKTLSPTEIVAEDHALSELSSLTEHRRIRLLQDISRLPSVLWFVLVVGGGVTIASASMFGSSNTVLHALQVFVFSLLIILALVAVADIDRPFQGSVHVSDVAFRRALRNMQQ
jgi:Protein of unknown function (DUF4239)